MVLNLCTVEGCDNFQYSRGWCRPHYQRRSDILACAMSDCDTPIKARGLCSKHYKRWQKHGDPLGEGGRPPAIKKHEILDLLQISGGWWTIPLIAERLEVNRSTVQKALHEFTRGGLVRRRKLGDRGTDRPEWKAT